ncbi:hypothetical protein [Sutterella sp.]|uniref:hypothetical protein n=1 Tax=Sutterella sp. TaxID=1981025 RepID=UPI0026DECB90|nr:hypothetical protein [Sutterella sp.]MDO5532315.1 hypothetical protein [Sutterella sp.]
MRRLAALFSQILLRFLEASRGRIALAALVIVLAAAAAACVERFSDRPFDADLAALLPTSLAPELDPALENALRTRLTGESAQAVIALVTVSGDPGSEQSLAEIARGAALAAEKVLLSSPALTASPAAAVTGLPQLPEAAGRLLTEADRAALKKLTALPEAQARAALTQRAVACLSSPAPKALGFSRDPFCSFDKWLAERLTALPWRRTEENGRAWLEVPGEDGSRTVVLLFTADPAQVSSGSAGLTATVKDAEAAAAAYVSERSPSARAELLAAGVPLFTDVIAANAQSEITLISVVSTVGVVVFAWLLFGRFSTIIFMAATVAAGFAIAMGASFAVFGTLSLVTFVFGATLIGVSIDYSSHWFALRRPEESARDRRRRLLAPLLCAAGSSAAAYLVLAVTPLPGLKQMAVLAAAGLIGTLFCVLAALPFVERFAPKGDTKLLGWLERTLPRIPRLTAETLRAPMKSPVTAALPVLFVVLLAVGLPKLEFASGVRDLQAAPQSLLSAQQAVAARLRIASPAQAFVVEGRTLDEALARESSLRQALAADPALRGVTPSGLSEWLPGLAAQESDRSLTVKAIELAGPGIEALLGAQPEGPGEKPLTLAAIAATPVAEAANRFVLKDDASGAALLLTLAGVTQQSLAPLHAAAAKAGDGVHFVDITRGMSEGLSLYRDRVLTLLALGLPLLWAALTLRFGRASWRAVLPSAIGILTAAAALGVTGHPLTLFAALAMTLLLGLGVDYGIFLTGSPNDGRTAAAVLFSGVTTMLSFGLLAFSATPALTVFGLTVLTGQIAIWIATPLLRPREGATAEATPKV